MMEVPESFKFPFEPYQIQLDFMKTLYKCIEERKLGIFESPTGTGKSLSIICGTLTWLLDHNNNQKLVLEKELEVLNQEKEASQEVSHQKKLAAEPAWFSIAKAKVSKSQEINLVKEKLQTIQKREERIKALHERVKAKSSLSKKQSHFKERPGQLVTNSSEDDDFLLEECENDEEVEEEDPSSSTDEKVEDTKIIFASRTHSQISQFVREVKKSPFGKTIRLCTLASRQQLCINEEITRLKSSSLINEKCIEMQKKVSTTTSKMDDRPVKKSKNCSCPYLNADSVQHVTDTSLTNTVDIENLVISGKANHGCPYYAARNAIKDAQVIVVPYSTLLQKETREACGLVLKNSVVIIDEAHNLLETISSIHGKSITNQQLTLALAQLSHYQQKYHTRLSAKNTLHIKQLCFFVSQLLKFLSPTNSDHKIDEEIILDCSKFCIEAGVDHLNANKLLEFCKQSKLSHKLANFKPESSPIPSSTAMKDFIEKRKMENKPKASVQDENSPTVVVEDLISNTGGSPLIHILEFMRCLLNSYHDGRVLCVRKVRPSASFLKYVLLNPGSLFKDFVTEPRSVIVAGGTMQPISEFELLLFGAAGAELERITKFSCGHIIPPHHVLPLILTNGPSDKLLDFSWANRFSLLDEIAVLLFNVVKVVPAGVVCFLPSYDFEKRFYDQLQKSGYLSKLEQHKTLFREPKEANQVDRVLSDYSSSIHGSSHSNNSCQKKGALLLCVVGGKLSEGINFSDDLARCVVVIGLPYPNSQSVELQAKMDYLNTNSKVSGAQYGSKMPGQLYYESLCFKAVNQSIGRAIRHSKDYAVLILADHRYSRPTSKSLLPEWIAQKLTVCNKYGQSISSTCKFLQLHKNSEK